ncbi:Nucleotidyl transferase AbiEii toxin, Type IV TA system [Salegentibacter agarivorans]|uniref:Nucleotidyl transferase AbiEii toxin, Type IV TA system n=1 Tax=Salegentibacter agarivorans TaxID=345907 RepID=A0A1I2QA56_9FLAO|nr:nucleotidyl transferase AbiEii/AbiGii toxin family protein [Salegentibacter agarivorans]SFG24269.1 Nucleotidyl transferase AbiEii toxin, Type IV TA system [Salegentibacter agarivorans]|tara:strand:- start:165 stop:1145 length:981 start_codon:yes stop_codon:yes gene_type:complete
MRLHQNKKLFKQAIQFTSDQMQIRPIYVEKDYWVTYVLYTIYNNRIGKDTIFKGGTALSKCYKIIERFSEDIDLVVLRNEGESNNMLTTKIREISKVVKEVLPEINIEGLTQKMGMNRKTAHSYSKEFEGNYGQVRDAIIVEATWLGYFEPYTKKKISSFIGEMMIENDQVDIVNEYELLSFEVLVLEPTRTICEKIMSLVRFSYSDNPVEDLKKKIRHLYDLHKLLQKKEFANFFNSKDFEEMLLKVANDDVKSYRNDNAWLIYHPSKALIFSDSNKLRTELKKVYLDEFQNLVYGEFPDEKELFSTLNNLRDRLLTIEWNIELK